MDNKLFKQSESDTQSRIDAVVFDADSTLVTIEGLDWLAKHKGQEELVAELTKKSMEGTMDFQEAMRAKMRIIAPSYEDLLLLGETYCQHIVDGAKHVIDELHSRGILGWILSGNFQPAVGILADWLGIPPQRVICNHVFFDDQHQYLGFDENNPLAKNGGKVVKIREVLDRPDKRVLLIGDGITDLDVQGHVACFVGFGGVVERLVVKQQADYYISEPSLMPLLDIVGQIEHT